MIVKAVCAGEFVQAAAKAAGVTPLTSPPLAEATFDPSALEGADLLYLDLHGAPGVGEWYGDGHVVAMTAAQVAQARLAGAVVFATNCYLADAHSPMLDALLDAGARYVVSGAGENYGGAHTLLGASDLGYHFRRMLETGLAPLVALAAAKEILRLEWLGAALTLDTDAQQAITDTLAFKAYERKAANG